ncbi:MAG: hypothetical protein GEV11_27290 [Streptosporangiales bacterium]|nr:hypothetical protein [Streptosporangiales bacterium]
MGFQPDVALFYRLAGTWREDVTLAGADTILAQEAALAALAGRGAEVVRVDSGGALNGALLSERLVDEVSLLVHPVLTGGHGEHRRHGSAVPSDVPLEPLAEEAFDGGVVWLRYRLGP